MSVVRTETGCDAERSFPIASWNLRGASTVLETESTVDGQDAAGNVIGGRRSQKRGRAADVLRSPQTTPRQGSAPFLDHGGRKRRAFTGRVDPTGFDGIDVDSVGGQFDRDGLRHQVQTGFGRAVGRRACEGHFGLHT